MASMTGSRERPRSVRLYSTRGGTSGKTSRVYSQEPVDNFRIRFSTDSA